MVDVPGGAFWMGCNPDADVPCGADELPGRWVELSGFSIQRTEATVSQWQACEDDGVCSARVEGTTDPDQPVTGMTNVAASLFCGWMGLRLPTEAEWEKAARGDDGRTWPWGERPPDCGRALLRSCGDPLQSVDAYPDGASPYGALQMVGNAWEWVSDQYDPAYYEYAPDEDPQGPDPSGLRVARGVSLYSTLWSARPGNREFAIATASCPLCGVRCALSQ